MLWLLLIACVVPEAVLQGADHGLWGHPHWRGTVYNYGAFWTGLLGDWRPNYSLQPLAMFATYGFLHAGLSHLFFNMLTLVPIGAAVTEQIGSGRFVALYAASLLGGGLGFAALSEQPVPMVGASGALFGLVGALMVWTAARTVRERGLAAAARAFLWPTALLALLNLAVWWGTGGALAWETHLGGFLAGVALAPLLYRRA